MSEEERNHRAYADVHDRNKKLLSFDEPEEQEEVAFKKKAIVRPDRKAYHVLELSSNS